MQPTTILAVERALIILNRLADAPDGLGVRELSRTLGYSPSVVQKILNTLKAHKFVEQDPSNGNYSLGPALLTLGLHMLSRIDVRQTARPHMERLSAASGETIFLGIRSGHQAIYVDKVTGNRPMWIDAALGAQRPLNCTAVGKVLLSGLSHEEIVKLARSGAFTAHTPNSITDLDALVQEIARVRERGYATDEEEFLPGAKCIAAPIKNHEGEIIAAITISAPAFRVDEHREEWVRLVRETAAAISTDLGYRE